MVDLYFRDGYRFRLKKFKRHVHGHIERFRGREKQFEEWLDQEISIFYQGTQRNLHAFDDKGLDVPKYKVLVSREFLHAYLLNQVSEESITALLNDEVEQLLGPVPGSS